MSDRNVAITATGVVSGLTHYLNRAWITNTDATNTVTLQLNMLNDGSGSVVWNVTLKAGDSVGEDWADLDLRSEGTTKAGLYATISGSGTFRAAVTGR